MNAHRLPLRAVKPELLNVLADPVSGEPLALDNGFLVAPGGARYEIRDGVPRLADPAAGG